nr:immunoglobulin heavy chain junction region [Macaca mulatta]MOX63763.1 immunoglobulin heavy chain junction region [Macaca mulatta]
CSRYIPGTTVFDYW